MSATMTAAFRAPRDQKNTPSEFKTKNADQGRFGEGDPGNIQIPTYPGDFRPSGLEVKFDFSTE